MVTDDSNQFEVFESFDDTIDIGIDNLNPFRTWDVILPLAKPGDLIEYNRGLYHHWAIYEGGSIVIHVRAHNGFDFEAKESSSIENCDRTKRSDKQFDSSFGGIIQSMSRIVLPSLTNNFDNDIPVPTNELNRPTPSITEALKGTIARLARDSFALVAGQSLIRINNKEIEARLRGCKPFSSERALENARSLLNQDVSYHMLTQNCEHYVTFWKYGVPWSSQTSDTALKLYCGFNGFYQFYKEQHNKKTNENTSQSNNIITLVNIWSSLKKGYEAFANSPIEKYYS